MSGIGDPTFRDDLRHSGAAWRRFPWLPAVSVGLSATTLLPDELWALAFVVLAFNAGWLGTERIVYLRAFRSGSLTVPELWRFTRAFVVRFAVLGLVVSLVLAPFLVLAFSHVLSSGFRTGFMVCIYALSLLIDVALTFVTPALAFTTRRVRSALSIGLRMARSEWPRCAWYVLVPPLAALFVAQTLLRAADVGIAGRVVASVAATLLNLWFKGAVAAYYVRGHEVGDEGAAFLA